jgi:hypothetical protein
VFNNRANRIATEIDRGAREQLREMPGFKDGAPMVSMRMAAGRAGLRDKVRNSIWTC